MRCCGEGRIVGAAFGASARPRFASACVLLAVLFVSQLAGCSHAVWYVAPEFGEKKAQKDNRPILYYFKAWDSTQHRNMLQNVFHDPQVDRELRDTINIELEYGFFDEQSERYKVHKPQVCVFAAPDGARLTPNYYVNPVPTPAAFLEWLRDAKRKAPNAGAAANDNAPEPTAEPAPRVTTPPQKMQ